VGEGHTQVDKISGQMVAAGEGITQIIGVARPQVTEADLAELWQVLADLKAQVEATGGTIET
jgi:hypothetical protein